MNRHGPYLPIPAELWDQQYVGGPVPFVGKGLTFFAHRQRPVLRRGHAVRARRRPAAAASGPSGWPSDTRTSRHPVTGLGADNYSIIEPDRMTRQFGAEFGDRFTEATVTSLYGNRYNRSAICQLKLCRATGDAGRGVQAVGGRGPDRLRQTRLRPGRQQLLAHAHRRNQADPGGPQARTATSRCDGSRNGRPRAFTSGPTPWRTSSAATR